MRTIAWIQGMLLLALWATPAQADEYLDLVREGVEESDAGNYPEARALFARAHEIRPNARTLRALGTVSFELRKYADAFRYLSAALSDPRRALTDQQRTETEALLERSTRFVGRYRITASGTDWQTIVDGRPLEGQLAILEIGAHQIVVRAGEQSQERHLEVVGGEEQELRFELSPPVESRDAPLPAQPVSHIGSTVAFVAGGVGVALFAIGASWGLSEKGDLDDGCRARSEGCTQSDVQRWRRLSRTADVGLGLAVVGAITGVVLRLVVEKEPGVDVVLHRHGGGLTFGGHF